METSDQNPHLTPKEAKLILAETDAVRTQVNAVSATPWPIWFVAVLTAMIAIVPIALGGMWAEPEWVMSQTAWRNTLLISEGAFLLLFVVAAHRWRRKTGVALRLDVLPKIVTVPLILGLPSIHFGAAYLFGQTGQAAWIFAGSAIGAAVSIGFHLWFVRLYRAQA